ncbi:hypothetical protein C3F09_06490 [candidate division GN15 bacterium]|uniref:DUF4861 domain-containing protein n=1 Tax=candidate division GN15 bacterium TaxID=2072418 RepID=A0A855X6Y6_9BACT|nr:MAG: hypothetical protein C3F09_06490 [candidate division GN15 bacterium]
MTRKGIAVAAALMAMAGTMLLIGCSDDKPTATTSTLTVTLSDFDQLLADIVPPEFVSISGVPSLAPVPPDTSFGCWTDGQGALLRSAFGNDRPMALHRNMHRLGETVQWMNRVRHVGDTTFSGIAGDSGTLSGTMTVARLGEPTDMPGVCQSVLGDTALQLQYRVKVQLNEQTQTRLHAGFRQDDTCELMLAYHGTPAPDSLHPNAYEHCLTYAFRHRVRDSVMVRAVHFKEYRNTANECAMWAYEVTSQNQNQFRYRMTWFADDFADSNGVGCMIGSGQGETQFALRYQQMFPAERIEPDTLDPHGHLYRLFGPNYADQGLTLTTAFNDATDPAKMYRYSDLPVALRLTPTGAEAALNPWFEQ